MLDVEGVQNDKQVGEAERANDPAAILWHTTAWSAEDVASAKVAKRAGESHKLPTLALIGKAVTFELQRFGLGENADEVEIDEEGICGWRQYC